MKRMKIDWPFVALIAVTVLMVLATIARARPGSLIYEWIAR